MNFDQTMDQYCFPVLPLSPNAVLTFLAHYGPTSLKQGNINNNNATDAVLDMVLLGCLLCNVMLNCNLPFIRAIIHCVKFY